MLFSLAHINQVSMVWIGVALLIFPIQFFIKAPYGRHHQQTSKLVVSNRLGWILMELPALLIMVFFMYATPVYSFTKLLLFVLYIGHYINRTLIFPLRIKTKGKTMPLSIVLSAQFFNLMNAGLNGYYLCYFQQNPQSTLAKVFFALGILLFIGGFLINNKADNMLIKLRDGNETDYKIPRGFLFNYISCPNLFGEMIEWIGFAMMGFSLPALSFAVWTWANLLPRAWAHHKWYQQKFNDYPCERKAVLPFFI